MSARALLEQLQARGARFELRGEDVLFRGPASVLTDEALDRLRAFRDEVRQVLAAAARPEPLLVVRPPRVRDPWMPGRMLEAEARDAQMSRHPRYGSPELAEALARYDAAETDLELEDATRALGAVLGWPGARR